MSNELMKNQSQELSFWDDKEKLKEIKKLFAPALSELEFSFFIGMGKATGLNPFLREIWAVKYGSGAAQVFIGRDGYRKAALIQPDYDYHYTEAVYSNDGFEVQDGAIKHKYNLLHRGQLIGAYCVVKRKSSSRPIHVVINITEYDKNQSVWKTMKETMLKKCAEANALRSTFPDILAGTYSDAEDFTKETTTTQTEKLKEKLNLAPNEEITVEGEVIEFDMDTDKNITIDQLKSIKQLIEEKDKDVGKILGYFKIDMLEQLSFKDANKLLEQLSRG